VPIRSAFVGALAGVLGVVGCLTFRDGLVDAASNPARSGVTWDFGILSINGRLPTGTLDAVAGDPAVADALEAVWVRAVSVGGTPTPTFATTPLTGNVPFAVISGRAPHGPDEIAFGPSTLRELHLALGDRVTVGPDPGVRARVVGTALLPATPHTDYDQGAWMTGAGLDAAIGSEADGALDFALARWKANVAAPAGARRLARLADDQNTFAGPAELPTSVDALGRLRTLPGVLTVFFAMLGAATVAHALVTTVRRRRRDLAILRALGFTHRQTRLAIGWQASTLAFVGLVVGIPLGLALGRTSWRWLAESFPVVYAPPLPVVVVIVVVPAALALANALAAEPARRAGRIKPAQALRTE
jgi:predicted lysophospholipase L1 biosynthesis ABC-type transport system permease subunit